MVEVVMVLNGLVSQVAEDKVVLLFTKARDGKKAAVISNRPLRFTHQLHANKSKWLFGGCIVDLSLDCIKTIRRLLLRKQTKANGEHTSK